MTNSQDIRLNKTVNKLYLLIIIIDYNEWINISDLIIEIIETRSVIFIHNKK